MLSRTETAQILWHRGELIWKLHKGQQRLEVAFRESPGKLFVADCSRQLGKSTWSVTKSVEVALQRPGAKIRYATAFLTDLEQFILPAFEFVLGDCPKDIAPVYKSQKSEWCFPNGSRIRLVGLDRKPNGLRGNKLTLIVLDEAGYISRLKYLYQFVLVPATTHVPHAKIIMSSTQPETPDHDFIEFCDKAAIEGGYIRLDVYQNPLLTKQQIEELAREVGGKASTAFRREYLCHRVVEEGRALIPEFSDSHIVVSPISAAHRFWYRIEALDSGVRDQTAMLFGYYDFARAKLVIEDEFAIQGAEVTTRKISELTKEKERQLGYHSVYRRIADNDNLILLQDLATEFQLPFASTDKDELAAMVNKVRLWFQSNRIEVHPRCKRLIGGLKAGIWNKQRTEFARSSVHGHYDIISSLVYMVRNCPEHDNPVPPFFNENLSEVMFQTQRIERGTIRELKKGFLAR